MELILLVVAVELVVEEVMEVVMEVVVGIVVDEVALGAQIRPDESTNIERLFAVDVLHAPHRVCANDDAPENMPNILITLDTSHLEMSPLNDVAC